MGHSVVGLYSIVFGGIVDIFVHNFVCSYTIMGYVVIYDYGSCLAAILPIDSIFGGFRVC